MTKASLARWIKFIFERCHAELRWYMPNLSVIQLIKRLLCENINVPYGYFDNGILIMVFYKFSNPHPAESGLCIRSPKWLGRFGPGAAPCEQNIKENAIRCNDRDGAKPSLQSFEATLSRELIFYACWNRKSFINGQTLWHVIAWQPLVSLLSWLSEYPDTLSNISQVCTTDFEDQVPDLQISCSDLQSINACPPPRAIYICMRQWFGCQHSFR